MPRVGPTQSPSEYFNLASASYKESTEEKQALLGERSSGCTALKTVEHRGWRFDLYKDSAGELIVAFRGTDSFRNWKHDFLNQIREPKIIISAMEEQIQSWEKEYGKEVAAFTGHSAGGYFAYRVFKGRDVFRVTFNAHKGERGDKSFALMLKSDPVSNFFSVRERYMCVGRGHHQLGDFEECLRERSWQDLTRVSDAFGVQKRALRLSRVIKSAIAGASVEYLHWKATHPDQSPLSWVKQIKKEGVAALAAVTVANLVSSKDDPLAESKPFRKTLTAMAFRLAKKGHKEGVLSFKDPDFLKEVLGKGFDDFLTEAGTSQDPSKQRVAAFVDAVVKAPAKEFVPMLAKLGISSSKREAIYQEYMFGREIPEDLKTLAEWEACAEQAEVLAVEMEKPEVAERLGESITQLVRGMGTCMERLEEDRFLATAGKRMGQEHERKKQLLESERNLKLRYPRIACYFHHNHHPETVRKTVRDLQIAIRGWREEIAQLRTYMERSQKEIGRMDARIEALNARDEKMHTYIQKRSRRFGKLSSKLTTLMLFVETATAVVTAGATVPVSLAVGAAGLGAGRQLLQGRLRRDLEGYEGGLAESMQSRQRAERARSHHLDQMQIDRKAQEELRHMLVQNRDWVRPEELRAELEQAWRECSKEREAKEKELLAVSTLLAKHEKTLEEKRPLERIGEIEFNAKFLEEVDDLRERKEDLETGIEVAKRFEQNAKQAYECEEYLAPLRDPAFRIVEEALGLREEESIQDARLKVLGAELVDIHNRFLLTGEARRHAWMLGFNAMRDVVLECGYWSGSQKPVICIDLLTQFYRYCDLSHYWNNHAYPQFDLVRRKYGDGGALGAFMQMGLTVTINQYFVPALQFISIGLSCLRMLDIYCSETENFSSEAEFFAHILQETIANQQKLIESQLACLGENMGIMHAETVHEIRSIQENLAIISRDAKAMIQLTGRELMEDAQETKLSDYLDLVKLQRVKKRKPLVDLIGLEKYVQSIQECLETSLTDLMNGYHVEQPAHPSDDRGYIVRPKVNLQLTVRNPAHFTGLIPAYLYQAQKTPNGFLFLSLGYEFLVKMKIFLSDNERGEALRTHLPSLSHLTEMVVTFLKFGNRLKDLGNYFSQLLEHATAQQAKFVESVTDSLTRSAQIKEAQIQERNRGNLRNLQLEFDRLEKALTADQKFSLYRITKLKGVKGDEVPLDLWGIENERQNSDWKFMTGGAVVVSGAAGIFGGPAVALVSAGFGAVGFGGMFGAFRAGRWAGDHMDGIPEIYRESEQLILRKLADSVDSFIELGELPASTRLKKRVQKLGYGYFSDVTYKADYSVRRCQFVYKMRIAIPFRTDHSTGVNYINKFSNQTKQIQKLLKFKVIFNLATQTYLLIFSKKSKLQPEDIAAITPPSMKLSEYRGKVKELVQAYCSAVRLHIQQKTLPDDHLFAKIVSQSELCWARQEGMLPIFIPKTMLDEIENFMQLEHGLMRASGSGALTSFYSFKRSELTGLYQLEIDFYTSDGKHYFSYSEDRFDQGTIESFGKLAARPCRHSQGEYEIYNQLPNMNEVLIHAWYTGVVEGLGMPGHKTHPVQLSPRQTIYAPAEEPFPGLWEIHHKYPTQTVHFDHRYYKEGNWQSFLSPRGEPKPGKDYFSIVSSLDQQKRRLSDQLKGYRDSYFLIQTLSRWLSSSSLRAIRRNMLQNLKLLPPESPDWICEAVMMGYGFDPAKEPDIQRFHEKIQRNPSIELQCLEAQLQTFQALQEALSSSKPFTVPKECSLARSVRKAMIQTRQDSTRSRFFGKYPVDIPLHLGAFRRDPMDSVRRDPSRLKNLEQELDRIEKERHGISEDKYTELLERAKASGIPSLIVKAQGLVRLIASSSSAR